MLGCGKENEIGGEALLGEDVTDRPESIEEKTEMKKTGVGRIPIPFNQENVTGVTVNYQDKVTDEVIYNLKESGVTYVRLVFGYPFGGDGITPSNQYLISKRTAKKFSDNGIDVMAQFIWPGGRGYDAATNSIVWLSNFPPSVSDYNEEYFYKAAKNAAKYMAADLKDICSSWLISNEIDISTYTGDMSFEQIVRYVEEVTAGVREGNPDASCGVNMLVEVNTDYSMSFAETLYAREDPVLDWLGLDGYYATLQMGGPQTWEEYIDLFYEKVQMPIIITEWSYSSAETDPSNSLQFQWEEHGDRGPERQAEYLAACMEVFARHPEVVGTFWYALHDSDDICWECGNPECRLYSSWGLLDVNGVPKPSLGALKEAALTFSQR